MAVKRTSPVSGQWPVAGGAQRTLPKQGPAMPDVRDIQILAIRPRLDAYAETALTA
jgi:hypothetical protein